MPLTINVKGVTGSIQISTDSPVHALSSLVGLLSPADWQDFANQYVGFGMIQQFAKPVSTRTLQRRRVRGTPPPP
ncbi:MAG: hypothetical protein ACREJ4_02585 [Candidatus Methylomirabilaceae bacterium]